MLSEACHTPVAAHVPDDMRKQMIGWPRAAAAPGGVGATSPLPPVASRALLTSSSHLAMQQSTSPPILHRRQQGAGVLAASCGSLSAPHSPVMPRRLARQQSGPAAAGAAADAGAAASAGAPAPPSHAAYALLSSHGILPHAAMEGEVQDAAVQDVARVLRGRRSSSNYSLCSEASSVCSGPDDSFGRHAPGRGAHSGAGGASSVGGAGAAGAAATPASKEPRSPRPEGSPVRRFSGQRSSPPPTQRSVVYSAAPPHKHGLSFRSRNKVAPLGLPEEAAPQRRSSTDRGERDDGAELTIDQQLTRLIQQQQLTIDQKLTRRFVGNVSRRLQQVTRIVSDHSTATPRGHSNKVVSAPPGSPPPVSPPPPLREPPPVSNNGSLVERPSQAAVLASQVAALAGPRPGYQGSAAPSIDELLSVKHKRSIAPEPPVGSAPGSPTVDERLSLQRKRPQGEPPQAAAGGGSPSSPQQPARSVSMIASIAGGSADETPLPPRLAQPQRRNNTAAPSKAKLSLARLSKAPLGDALASALPARFAQFSQQLTRRAASIAASPVDVSQTYPGPDAAKAVHDATRSGACANARQGAVPGGEAASGERRRSSGTLVAPRDAHMPCRGWSARSEAHFDEAALPAVGASMLAPCSLSGPPSPAKSVGEGGQW